MKTREQIQKLVVSAMINYGDKLTSVVDVLYNSQRQISIYNLAHNEIDSNCCGIFDRINDDGLIICNECNKTMREIVLGNLKETAEEPKTLLVTENNVEIKFGDELWCYHPNILPYKFYWDSITGHSLRDGKNSLSDSYKFFSSEAATNDYIEKQKPKIVFTTEDGYEIKEGEDIELHGINLDLSIKNTYAYEYIRNVLAVNFLKDGYKWFKDKEKAFSYLAKNYNFLSCEEVLEIINLHIYVRDMKTDIIELSEEKAHKIIP